MNIWVGVALELLVGYVVWVVGTVVWRIRFTKILFLQALMDPRVMKRAFDSPILNDPLVRSFQSGLEELTRKMREINKTSEPNGVDEEESIEQIPMRFSALFTSTLRAWQVARNWNLLLLSALIVGSFVISPYCVLINLLIVLLLSRFVGKYDEVHSDALTALYPIVRLAQQWFERDPVGCRKWCTELCPQFDTMFSVVSSNTA